MKVWIDQDLCTGDGLCEEIAPSVFTLLDDGLAYVKEGDKVFSDPGGAEASPTCPRAWKRPSSSPPRSAPASASSSRSTDRSPHRPSTLSTRPAASAPGRCAPRAGRALGAGARRRRRQSLRQGPVPLGVGAVPASTGSSTASSSVLVSAYAVVSRLRSKAKSTPTTLPSGRRRARRSRRAR